MQTSWSAIREEKEYIDTADIEQSNMRSTKQAEYTLGKKEIGDKAKRDLHTHIQTKTLVRNKEWKGSRRKKLLDAWMHIFLMIIRCPQR